MREKTPCAQDCPNRTAECHSTCKAYMEWSERRRALLDERYEKNKSARDVDNYIVVGQIKRRKASRRH